MNINKVNATSGYLKKSSIKTCNGVTYGKHGDGHWHVAVKNGDGRYNASGDAIYSNPCGNNTSATSNKTYKKQVVSKSSNNTIKAIIVNDEKIDVKDHMDYKTKKDTATIEVILNDAKASVEYDKEKELTIGNNTIIIKVKAENGNLKEYNLNIVREKILSSNKNIKIMLNKEEIQFVLFKKSDITVSSSTEKVDITYELEDLTAKVEIKGNDNLKEGNNEIVITVTAENGDKQDYTLIVIKNSQASDIVSTVIGLGGAGGIGYAIYNFKKEKIKK